MCRSTRVCRETAPGVPWESNVVERQQAASRGEVALSLAGIENQQLLVQGVSREPGGAEEPGKPMLAPRPFSHTLQPPSPQRRLRSCLLRREVPLPALKGSEVFHSTAHV